MAAPLQSFSALITPKLLNQSYLRKQHNEQGPHKPRLSRDDTDGRHVPSSAASPAAPPRRASTPGPLPVLPTQVKAEATSATPFPASARPPSRHDSDAGDAARTSTVLSSVGAGGPDSGTATRTGAGSRPGSREGERSGADGGAPRRRSTADDAATPAAAAQRRDSANNNNTIASTFTRPSGVPAPRKSTGTPPATAAPSSTAATPAPPPPSVSGPGAAANVAGPPRHDGPQDRRPSGGVVGQGKEIAPVRTPQAVSGALRPERGPGTGSGQPNTADARKAGDTSAPGTSGGGGSTAGAGAAQGVPVKRKKKTPPQPKQPEGSPPAKKQRKTSSKKAATTATATATPEGHNSAAQAPKSTVGSATPAEASQPSAVPPHRTVLPAGGPVSVGRTDLPQGPGPVSTPDKATAQASEQQDMADFAEFLPLRRARPREDTLEELKGKIARRLHRQRRQDRRQRRNTRRLGRLFEKLLAVAAQTKEGDTGGNT